MKKSLLIAAAALISAFAFAATNVTSVNIVGYNNIETVGGAFTIAGAQFMSGTGNTITETLGTNSLPIGSKVYKWNGIGYNSITYTYLVTSTGFPPVETTNGIGWTVNGSDVSTDTLGIGEGFWVEDNSSAGVTNQTIISGEVVLDTSITNTVLEGFNMFASPYPTEVAVTNLGFTASLGDKIYLWNGEGYNSVTYTYLVTSSGFPPVETTNGVGWTANGSVESDAIVNVGQGFWYEATATNDWVMARPFTLTN